MGNSMRKEVQVILEVGKLASLTYEGVLSDCVRRAGVQNTLEVSNQPFHGNGNDAHTEAHSSTPQQRVDGIFPPVYACITTVSRCMTNERPVFVMGSRADLHIPPLRIVHHVVYCMIRHVKYAPFTDTDDRTNSVLYGQGVHRWSCGTLPNISDRWTQHEGGAALPHHKAVETTKNRVLPLHRKLLEY